MKIIIDDKIPYIKDAATQLFDEVVFLPGAAMTPADVKEADALIVRTRTQCNEALLKGSKVQFIATATIGFDHFDTTWLDKQKIHWVNCPGCNATSVAQYIRNSLIVLHKNNILDLASANIGIVGVGHVGSAVAKALGEFGCKLWLCDPPREEQEHLSNFHTLQTLAEQCDVITFHTPLTSSRRYATRYMADERFFQSLTQKPVIINAARGGVIKEAALLAALETGHVRAAVIDTWENEPRISEKLLDKAVIATPHIAGYSADGKATATRMALEAVCRHFGIAHKFKIVPPKLPSDMQPSGDAFARHLQLYNPRNDSDALKADVSAFEHLRGHHPLRRELWDQ